MTKSPKTDRLREMREAKHGARVFTGININKGVTLTPEMAKEVLQAAADNVANWSLAAPEEPRRSKEISRGLETGRRVSSALPAPNCLTSSDSKPCETNKPGFDKRAYQRELMRKRRAK